MATIRSNAVAGAFSGSIGNIVFRQLRGKPVISCKPPRPEKQSQQQRENRMRFKCATAWAKAQMLDENKKTYYWRMARKLKLPNAYTAAVSDYMRKGNIREIDTRQYKGKAGDVIRMKISKRDFCVKKVNVVLRDASGNLIENGFAMSKDKNTFIYRATKTVDGSAQMRLCVTIDDHPWNVVKREMLLSLDSNQIPA